MKQKAKHNRRYPELHLGDNVKQKTNIITYLTKLMCPIGPPELTKIHPYQGLMGLLSIMQRRGKTALKKLIIQNF